MDKRPRSRVKKHNKRLFHKKIILLSSISIALIFVFSASYKVSIKMPTFFGPPEIMMLPLPPSAVINHIPEEDKPLIALTFDDGPSKAITNKILDVLEGYGSHATFFVVGSRVPKNGETLNRILSTGNEIGNHTYNHKHLTKIDLSSVKSEISETNKVINNATGKTPTLMRPTYGAYNESLLKNAGMTLVNWSVDTLDWKTRDAKKVANEIIKNAEDGAIILMHDLYESTAEAIEIAVPKLVEMGYRLVTVSEMFDLKNIEQTNGKVYNSIQ